MSHWKAYEPIDDVMTFGPAGEGPVFRRVNVTANMHLSRTFSARFVRIGMVGIGLLSLTVEQSAALRAQLERAERDVAAGVVDADPPEVTCG